MTLHTLVAAVFCIAAAVPTPRAHAASAASQAPAAEPAETMSLQEALTLALAHSPDLSLARAQRRVSADQVGTERAQFGPNLYTGTGAMYTYGFPQTPGGATPSILNLSYVQTVFDPASRGALEAAEARLAAQSASVEQVRWQVIATTASTYLELTTLRRAIDAQQTAGDAAARLIAITDARVKAGRELPVAGLRARLESAELQQSLVQLEGRAGIVEERLRTLIGAPAGQPITVRAETLPVQSPAPIDTLVARALESSPTLRQAEDERRARQAALGGAKGAYLPSVDVVGQYGLFGRFNNYDQFFQRFQRNNVNVGVEVQVPIFSANTSAAAALATSQLAEADAALTRQRQALTEDVRDKARQVKATAAALDVARLQASVAAETVRELAARVKAGLAAEGDLARAQLQAAHADVARLDAALAADQAELNLWTVTGQIERLIP